MKSVTQQRKGQSLVEAIVALGILTTGFLGILTLLAQSLALNSRTEHELIATYLSEEGLELAKNFIDHDVYAKAAGASGATGWGTCIANGDYELDYSVQDCPAGNSNEHVAAASAMHDPLYFNSSTELYGYHIGGAPSIYTRDIRVTRSGDEITVNSIVTWPVNLTTQSVNLEDHFYNWLNQ